MTSRTYADRPGRYEQVTAWLRDHPDATINEIAEGIGVYRDRAILCLRHGMATGDVTRYRDNPRHPWKWDLTP